MARAKQSMDGNTAAAHVAYAYLRLLRASGMAKDSVDVLKRRLRFCFSLSSTLLLYGQIMETSLRSSERFGKIW